MNNTNKSLSPVLSSSDQIKDSLFNGAINLQKQVSELILVGLQTIPMAETDLMLNSTGGAMKVYLMAIPKEINPADIELYVKR